MKDIYGGHGFWILAEDGRTPILTNDMKLVSRMFNDHEKKVVGRNRDEERDITVSTVFLAFDHGWEPGKPVLFETMVFGGEDDGYIRRYHTWEEAERGHGLICGRVGIPWNQKKVG